jgi:DNA (cytosine-5)-methyltransferase 1
MRKKLGDKNLPGFPIWADEWVTKQNLRIPKGTPEWKKNFLRKNSEFYTLNKSILDKWLKKWNYLENFPPSRRKFEWQAQDSKTLWETIMHFRPSGIRAKKATYVPALVAITQTSILGKHKRRITIREGARLQGFPEWFDFVDQADSITYKQLGNGVNIGVVFNVLKAQVIRDLDLLGDKPQITRSVLGAPSNPDELLKDYKTFFKHQSKSSNISAQPKQILNEVKIS